MHLAPIKQNKIRTGIEEKMINFCTEKHNEGQIITHTKAVHYNL